MKYYAIILQYLFIVYVFSSYGLINAQSLHFENISALDGLSSSEVYDIIQDNQGYLWFATDRGLTRYDGKNFMNYTTSDGLTDNVVFNFVKADDDKIWCYTLNQTLFYFYNAEDGFYPYKHNDVLQDNLPRNTVINNIAFTKDNGVLISLLNYKGYLLVNEFGECNDFGLIRSRDNYKEYFSQAFKTVKNFSYFNKKKTGCLESDIDFKIENPTKNLRGFSRLLEFPEFRKRVLIFGDYCYIIDTEGKYKTRVISHKKGYTANCAGKLDNKTFWIGYRYAGGQVIDLEGNLLEHYVTDESVTKMYLDHENGLWIATLNSGVFYCNQTKISNYQFDSFPVELAKDKKENLYISTHNGKILKKDRENKFDTIYHSKQKNPTIVAYNHKYNSLLYGDVANFGIIGEQLLRGNLHSILRASDNVLEDPVVLGRNSYCVLSEGEAKKNISQSRIFDVEITPEGHYLGTLNGLYYYNGIENESFLANSLLNQRIQDIDSNNETLYLATMGKGLVIKKKDTIFSIESKNGLLSDITTEVYLEDKYTIWVATNRGLNRVLLYANNTYEIQSLSLKDGLQCSEISDIEMIGNTVWIASKEGLFSFQKNLVETSKRPIKKWLKLDAVIVNTVNVSKTQREYTHKENNITFKYTAISFRNKGKREYRYRLNRNSDSWVYSSNNEVTYHDLDPGEYEFNIAIKGEDGMYHETEQYAFVIKPSFFNTNWFIILLAVLCTISINFLFKYRLLILNKKLAYEISRLLLKKLKRKDRLFVNIKNSGKTIKLPTSDIGYFKSSGNYVEIHTQSKKYFVRGKIFDFYTSLPDQIEFLQTHRSYYVRIDKVFQKSSKHVTVLNDEIPVSKTYLENLNKIDFALHT